MLTVLQRASAGLELPAHERITVLPIKVGHVHGRPDPFLAKFRTVTEFLRSGGPPPEAVLLIDVDAVVVSAISADEVVALLEKLHGLKEKGILSEEEFASKKAELLGRLA